MNHSTYAVVIATMERPDALHETLASLAVQTRPAHEIIVVDASTDSATADLCARWQATLPLRHLRAITRSAALQRNQGAAETRSPLIAFMDDDVVLPVETLARLMAPFADAAVGGVAGRIEGLSHPPPRGLLWLYYRLQAGYPHSHYGARVIGPGINLLPCFERESTELIPAQWLNSTCVIYRRELFARELFPAFAGYSFMEDAHLSFRIGRTHTLFFHAGAPYQHNCRPSSAKADRRALHRMIVHHQRLFARDLLGLRGFTLAWKLTLHRLFQSVAVLRSPEPRRLSALRGLWS